MNVPFNGVKTTAHVQQNAEKLTMNSCFDCFFLVAAVNQTDGSIWIYNIVSKVRARISLFVLLQISDVFYI